MSELKESLKSIGNRVAYNSVGKSSPIMCYEPKVPSVLKQKVDVTRDEK